MTKTLKETFSDYFSQNKAIPAFNIDSFEIYQAVEAVVAETGSPCIVQLSAGEDKFIQAERLLMLVKKSRIDGLPIYLNMDHGADLTRLENLINLGFDMVHFDGSDLPFDQNLKSSIDFINKVKIKNPDVLIETEFNKINLVNSQISSDSFTNVDQAFDFINQTKTDLLAISIGNLHGVSLDQPEVLNLELLKQIKEKLPNQFFTLHGGSGVDSAQISASLKLGIVKININTDLRNEFLKSLKTNLDNNKSDKVYKLLTPVVDDLKIVIKNKFLCMM